MKLLKTLARLIGISFFIFFNGALSLSLLEVVTYEGFIYKHLRVDLMTIIILIVILGAIFLLIFSVTDRLMHKIVTYQKRLLIYGSLCTMLLYYLTVILDTLIYPNFAFSRFHLMPANFTRPLFLSSFGLLICFVYLFKMNKKNAPPLKKIIRVFLSLFFLLLLFLQNLDTPLFAVSELKYLFTNPKATAEDKFGYKWGGRELITVIELVKELTPAGSTIAIPYRQNTWGIEGNDHVMRGFLYPRQVVSQTNSKKTSYEKIDFMLISWGFWRSFYPLPPNGRGFPDFMVKAKKIYLFDLKSRKAVILDKKIYDPNDSVYNERYGLIELP